MLKIENPIIKGFYPDPSICRVEDEFFLVNSSFGYFPGVPIFKTKDLKNWEQIGNVLDRKSQLPLEGCGISEGIFAPTIRYHQGIFYMITTNVSYGGNFIVTAKDPQGPWSEPCYLEGAEGIDPSLFFDDDGKVYYIGTRPNPQGVQYNGDWCIYIQELDINKMSLVGDYQIVWQGALKEAIWPEGPHLYKRNGYYYILHAEGGTGSEHAISVARSNAVFGPYTGNPCNPIFTHRHLGRKFPIGCVGHGDMVEGKNGEWYGVVLATRHKEGYTNLGRETFLVKIEWEEEWPVFNPGIGMLEKSVEVDLEEQEGISHSKNQNLLAVDNNKLPECFVFIRNPEETMVTFTDRQSLVMKLQTGRLWEKSPVSYLGIRITNHQYEGKIQLLFHPENEGDLAGLALFHNEEANLQLVYGILNKVKGVFLILKENQKTETLLAFSENTGCLKDTEISLSMVAKNQKLQCFCQIQENKVIKIGPEIDLSCFSTEVAGGFIGNTLGMYGRCQTDNSVTQSNEKIVEFKCFNYKNIYD